MPSKRKPNHDAAGNDLAGQEVNYNATTGDSIVINGLVWEVLDTYPNGIRIGRKTAVQERTYKELIRVGAFFAKIN